MAARCSKWPWKDVMRTGSKSKFFTKSLAASFGESLPWKYSFNVLASVAVGLSKNEFASASLSHKIKLSHVERRIAVVPLIILIRL